jgi:ribokinase
MRIDVKPIVVVGSINIDFVVTTDTIPVPGETVRGNDFQLHPGGKGANQAVAVARLGYPVEMIGRVGSDLFGERLIADLRGAGVGTSAVEETEGSSGVATITVAAGGENTIVITPGANAAVTPEFIERHSARIRGAGLVLAQLEIPMESVNHLAALCQRTGVPLILDPAPARALGPEVLPALEWLTPNETEAAFYAEAMGMGEAGPQAVATALLAGGARGVVLKMGANGALLATADGAQHKLSPFEVEAVDTTAAGDAFNGAFAAGLMLGMSATDAGRFACAAAAISVTGRGAQPSMPDRAAVDALLLAEPR